MLRSYRAMVLVVGLVLLGLSAPSLLRADDDSAQGSNDTNHKGHKKGHGQKHADADADKAAKPTSIKKDDSKTEDEDKDDVFVPAKDQPATEKPADKPAAKSAKKPKEDKPISFSSTGPTLAFGDGPSHHKANVVRIVLSGSYPEGAPADGLLSEAQPSLKKLIDRLDAAAADKNVQALWLRIDDIEVGRGEINEIRAAIARIRAAGKPVFAESSGAETAGYLIASACDQIYMAESGAVMLPGVRMEITFYKNFLDKIGVQFDALKMGKYKGAVEPYTRSSMSEPLKESLEALVDDTYEDMVGSIATDRHMTDFDVKKLIDQSLFSATAAKKAGLIDDVCYGDQIEAKIRAKCNVDELTVDRTYKKKQVDTDFSGMGGLIKLMEIFSGSKATEKKTSGDKIAVIYAVGTISEGKSSGGGLLSEATIGSTTMVETINKAMEDPKVKAIVLRVDSPGGSATASDLIWRAITAGKKPVVTSMGNLAASGGYYISMGTKKIFAEPSTITGSIGVFGGKMVTGGLYTKLGMTTEVIARGANGGAMSSNTPFSEGEKKVWIDLLQETYHEFVSKASAGRHIPYDRLDAMAQGRVYTGRQAKKLGLVDEIGTLKDAIASAKSLAGIAADKDIEIESLPKSKSMIEQLFGGDAGGEDDVESSLVAALKSSGELHMAIPELQKLLGQVRIWRKLANQHVLLWTPYELKLK
jgi:protease-4